MEQHLQHILEHHQQEIKLREEELQRFRAQNDQLIKEKEMITQ